MDDDADIIVVCGCSGSISCHREILTRYSHYFETHLLKSDVINLVDITCEEFLIVLEILYTSDSTIFVKDVTRIVSILNELEIHTAITCNDQLVS
jgi:hypothetical protein